MKNVALCLLLACSIPAFGQVEITPNSVNSVIRTTSTDKGILLPKVSNPSVVNSPEQGLIIYDKASNAPAFHNGTEWKSMMMPMPVTTGQDSLTYTFLTGFGPLFELNSPLPFASMSFGASNSAREGEQGVVNWQDMNLAKAYDRNTHGFVALLGSRPATTSIVIEIKVYKKGTTVHYFSYKLTNVRVTSVSHSLAENGGGIFESISLSSSTYGFRDNVTGVAIAYRLSDGVQVPY